MNQDIYYGAIVVFYKRTENNTLYLTVKNARTGNVSFLSGAQEGNESATETAQREVNEELALESNMYSLSPTEIFHDFVFDADKKERAGAKGSYQVFVADATNIADIQPTKELKEIWWKTENETIESLTFEDVRNIFQQVLNSGVIAG